MANQEVKPWYKRPLVLVSIGAGFVGLAATGVWLYKRSQNNSGDNNAGKASGADEFDNEANKQAPQIPAASMPFSYQPSTTAFPLRSGSRGESVMALQNAIIKRYGANALPKYGADGDWGGETQKFFDSHPELKSVIDNATFSQYVKGNFSGSGSSTNPDTPKTTASGGLVTDMIKSVIPSWVTDPNIKIGWQLFDAAKAKSLGVTISFLKKLNNVNDYSSASQGFQLRPYGELLRRYTLVTGLLDAFKSSSSAKQAIREQFKRIGLVEKVKNSDPENYDSTWTLSGIGSSRKQVRTKMKAIITDGFNISVEIPTRTLLGQWLSSGNGYTRFRTYDGRTMYVRTNSIVLE